MNLARLLTVVILVVTVSPAWGGIFKTRRYFDHNRQGFIVGACIGPGLTYYSSERDGRSASVTRGNLTIDFRIGYSPNERWQFYYSHRASLFWDELGEDIDDYFSKVTIKDEKSWGRAVLCPFAFFWWWLTTDQYTVGGFGMSYYRHRRSPCYFFELGLGPSLCSNPIKDERSAYLPGNMPEALAVFGSVGYEFTEHIGLQLGLEWSHKSRFKNDHHDKWNVLSLNLTANFIAY